MSNQVSGLGFVGPPDFLNPAKRKRRRKLLSCYDCRRRKLQCDRAMPACGRCVRSGQASDCLYLESASEARALASHSGELQRSPAKKRHCQESTTEESRERNARSVLQNQDCRNGGIESNMNHQYPRPLDGLGDYLQPPIMTGIPLTPESVSGNGVTLQSSIRTVVRNRSSRTPGHGRTNPAFILDIPELRTFNNEVHDHFSAITRMRKEMREEETGVKNGQAKSHGRVVTDADLRSLLPPKPETDELVHLYLDLYGKMLHVLYMPTFWEAYANVWSNLESADAHFVAIVVGMIAAAVCLRSSSLSLFEARVQSDEMIDALEMWIAHRAVKRSVISDLQVRVVLAIAKQSSARKLKENYNELGDLLQLCIAEGLHEERSGLEDNNMTCVQRELRRRIWAAVTELELQASFDYGKVSVVPRYECSPPVNIHDRDLAYQGVNQEPESTDDFTRVMYLSAASSSQALRLDINKYLNNLSKLMDFRQVKHYTDALQMHLSAISERFSSRQEHEVPRPLCILQLHLRQYILVLNDRFIQETKIKSEKDFSRMIALQQAVKIMRIYSLLSVPIGQLALELFRVDQVRAALSVCYVASQLSDGPNRDLALSAWADAVAGQVVPAVLSTLKDKVVRIGREQRHLWSVLVADAYMKSKKDPTGRLRFMQGAVDGMTEAYNGMMAARAEIELNRNALELPQSLEEVAAWAFDDAIDSLDGPVDLFLRQDL